MSRHSGRGFAAPRYTQTLQQAMRAHQAGELEHAEGLYRRVLTMRVGQPDAMHYLGVLLHQRGHSDAAVKLVGDALRVTPQHADAHSNLGNIHKECGRIEQAEACYRQALRLVATHPQALGNLAIALEAQQRIDEARDAYRHWLDRHPGESRAHYHFGRFLCSHARERSDIEDAVECFRTAHRLDNTNLRALESLGIALYSIGGIDAAAQVYRDWAALDPADPIPRHMLAACGAAEAPARAGDDYVRELFDRFASSFDEQLLGRLGYRAPQALIEALGDGGEALDVLDAGCGTGLCGPLLRERARTLVGVDLSERMLEQARRRGCYDELSAAELTAHLRAHAQTYDLVVCADTLIYFGELDTVLDATHRALRPGGRFAFSLEALRDSQAPRFALTPAGRYQHSREYAQQCMAAAGFVDAQITEQSLRKEAGKWVDGWVVLAQRPH
ncbi:tetratricopeptide repeat protein [Paraburkholderia rhizosphaerae]|uniref:Putative TPR repeat methyltransferase n=1 Tax=Paraburkholderia rhizosphaerae TaxID=480658 RepID=A0A4R8LX42_9BURK|nr:tetratricopeptide repeat protein [Paraburkholderia rhizosphaerae]TDY52756.1 putative TPR repeat methyltransferase [Paraburkholderia rhizosphaerae]